MVLTACMSLEGEGQFSGLFQAIEASKQAVSTIQDIPGNLERIADYEASPAGGGGPSIRGVGEREAEAIRARRYAESVGPGWFTQEIPALAKAVESFKPALRGMGQAIDVSRGGYGDVEEAGPVAGEMLIPQTPFDIAVNAIPAALGTAASVRAGVPL